MSIIECSSGEFWISLLDLIKEARTYLLKSQSLYVCLENVDTNIKLSDIRNKTILHQSFGSKILYAYLKLEICTEIVLKPNGLHLYTAVVEPNVLQKLKSILQAAEVQCETSLTPNGFSFYVNLPEKMVILDHQLLNLIILVMREFYKKDPIIYSAETVVLPMMAFGSIELEIETYSESEATLLLYNSSGLCIGKLLRMQFYTSQFDSKSISNNPLLSYLEEIGVCTTYLNEQETFLQMGIDSLQKAQFEILLNNKFSTEIGITEKYDTLSKLSEYIQTFSIKLPSSQIERKEKNLSHQQMQMLVMNQLQSQARDQFTEVVQLRFNNSYLNVETLRKYCNQLIMRHSIFRTMYETSQEKQNSFTILSGTECYLHLPECTILATQPIDIEKEISVKIITKEEDSNLNILFNFHHISVDSVSISIVMKELYYLIKGEDISPTKQYYECPQEIKDKDISFWKLQDFTSCESPVTSFPRKVNNTSRGKQKKIILPKCSFELLHQLRQRHNVTDFTIFISLYFLLIHKTMYISNICVGFPVSTRRGKEELSVVGNFVNTLPLVYQIFQEKTFFEMVEEIHKKISDSISHSSLPFRDIVKYAYPEGNYETLPIFKVLIVQDNKLNIETENLKFVERACNRSKYEQTWYFEKRKNEYHLTVEYQTDLYSDSSMDMLLEKYLYLLSKFEGYTINTRILDVSICSQHEMMQLTNTKLNNVKDFPKKTVLEIFIENSKQSSNYFQYENDKITHSECVSMSDYLQAVILQEYASFYGELLTCDRTIVLLTKRNLLLPQYILSGWFLGMAIVPISYDWPEERILTSIRILHNPLIITDKNSILSSLKKEEICFLYFINSKFGKVIKRSRRFNKVLPEDLAYITFTSGSTGTPKAVCTSFKGHSNLASEYSTILPIGVHSIIYQVVNYAFDIFFADLSKVFANGASCVLARDMIPNMEEVSKCSNAYIMPAFLSSQSKKNLQCMQCLESLQFGGELIQPNTLNILLQLNIIMYQEYGLTEQTVYTSYRRVRSQDRAANLGTPYHNLALNVRDSGNQVLPLRNMIGELCLFGMLCRGYYGNNEANKKLFAQSDSEKLIRTADLVQCFDDQVNFLCRLDAKIKINGQIVDTNDIQQVICSIPEIDSCMILSHVLQNSTTLVAYATRNSTNIDEYEVINHLKKHLPDYSVPKIVVFLCEFPKTANGKIDKSQLPVPPEEAACDKLAKLDQIQTNVLQVVYKYVSKSYLNSNSNLYLHGADSLKFLLMVQELQTLGYSIELQDIMREKSVNNISNFIRENWSGSPNNKHNTSLSPNSSKLTSSQKRLMFIQKLLPNSDAYIIKLQLNFKGNLNIRKLETMFNIIIMNNYALRTSFTERKGEFTLNCFSGTECYNILNKNNLTLPSPNQVLTTSFTSISERHHILQLWIHHITIDGRSIAILMNQLVQLYNGKEVKFQNFLENEEDKDFCFWKNHFKDYKSDEAIYSPSEDAGYRLSTEEAGYRQINLSYLQNKLNELVGKADCTIFNIMLTAYIETLREFYEKVDLVTLVTVANRQYDNMDTVGLLNNTLPVRFSEKCNSKRKFLNYCKKVMFDILSHSSSSLINILENVNLNSNEINTCVTYQSTSAANFPDMDDVTVTIEYELPTHTQFQLAFIFFDDDNRNLQVRIEYSTVKFTSDNIQRIQSIFLRNLDEILEEYSISTFNMSETHGISEHRITELFEEVLQIKGLTSSSNFFQLGGHSLKAVKLIYLLSEEFQQEIPLQILFENPTPESLSAFLKKDDKKNSTGSSDNPSFFHSSVMNSYENLPTYTQIFLLKSFRDQSLKDLYNLELTIKLKNNHSNNNIIRCINSIIMYHPSLRTTFVKQKGNFKKYFLSGTECFQNPFLGSKSDNDESLFMIQYSEDKKIKLKINHILVDGHSLKVIANDFLLLLKYKKLKAYNLNDYHVWLNSQFEEHKKNCEEYWMTMFRKFGNVSQFPSNYDRSAGCIEVEIQNLHTNLQKLSSKFGKTSFLITLTILSNALQSIYNKPVAIGFPVNLREEKFQKIVDFSITTLCHIINATGNPQIDITTTSDVFIDSMSHRFISELQTLFPNKSLYDVMLVYDHYTVFENEEFTLYPTKETYVKSPITIFVHDKHDKLVIDYAINIVSEENVLSLAKKFENTLLCWIEKEFEEHLGVMTTPESYPLSKEQQQMFFLSNTRKKTDYVLPFIKKVSTNINELHARFLTIMQFNEQFRTIFYETHDGPRQKQLSMTECYLSPQAITVKDLPFFLKHFKNSEDISPERPIVCVFIHSDEGIFAHLLLHHIISDASTTFLLEKDLDFSQKLTKKPSFYEYLRKRKNRSNLSEQYINRLFKYERLYSEESEIELSAVEREISSKFLTSSKVTPFVLFLKAFSEIIFERTKLNNLNIGFPFTNRSKTSSTIYGYFLNNLIINISPEHTVEQIQVNVDWLIEENFPFIDIINKSPKYDSHREPYEIYINFRYHLEKKLKNEDYIRYLPSDIIQHPVEIDVDQTFENNYIFTIRSNKYSFDDLSEISDKLLRKLSNTRQTFLLGETSTLKINRNSTPVLERVLKVAKSICNVTDIRPTDNFFNVGGNSLLFITFIEELESFWKIELDYNLLKKSHSFKEISELITTLFESNNKNEYSSKKHTGFYSSDFPIRTISQVLLMAEEAYSDDSAIISQDETKKSYKDMISQSKQIAYEIQNEYVKVTGQSLRADDIIPVISHNSLDVHIWIQAIQLCGACYMPILDNTPTSRISQMLSQTPNIHVYIGQQIDGLHLTFLETFNFIHEDKLFFNKNTPYDLAYIINTSGTTGVPKGVCIKQLSVSHMMNGSTKDFFVNNKDVTYQATLFVYDNSILETWMTLCNGACLLLANIPCIPRHLARLITKHKITICCLFPALVAIFKDDMLKKFVNLRYWIVGAEKLPDNLLQKAISFGIDVIQNYGPTETTAYALTRRMRSQDNPQNLGYAIQNTKIQISAHRSTLLISGIGLMRGYLVDKKRIPLIHLDANDTSLWYDTGDIVNFNQEDNVIFIGRIDNQVKIRGHRVELSDIENVCCRHPEIQLCKVLYEEAQQYLIAYFITENGKTINSILEFCREHLPAHMVPTQFHFLKQFPLTSNLKVDITALKSIDKHDFYNVLSKYGFTNFNLSFVQHGGYTLLAHEIAEVLKWPSLVRTLLSPTPLKQIQLNNLNPNLEKLKNSEILSKEILLNYWQQLLRHEEIEETSNFYQVGGNSMLLLQLSSILKQYREDIGIEDLLNNLGFQDMLKLYKEDGKMRSQTKNVRSVWDSEDIKTTFIMIHPLYAGCTVYRHLIKLISKNIKNCRIVVVEHPNTFGCQTLQKEYFESLETLSQTYADELKPFMIGQVVLIGASMGGTIATILQQKIIHSIVIMIDSTSELDQLKTYSFQEHKENFQQFVASTTTANDDAHWMLLNSWDLIQLLKFYQHVSLKNLHHLYQLSLDGTDLFWSKWLPEIVVRQISGTHSTMLNSLNAIHIFQEITQILSLL